MLFPTAIDAAFEVRKGPGLGIVGGISGSDPSQAVGLLVVAAAARWRVGRRLAAPEHAALIDPEHTGIREGVVLQDPSVFGLKFVTRQNLGQRAGWLPVG